MDAATTPSTPTATAAKPSESSIASVADRICRYKSKISEREVEVARMRHAIVEEMMFLYKHHIQWFENKLASYKDRLLAYVKETERKRFAGIPKEELIEVVFLFDPFEEDEGVIGARRGGSMESAIQQFGLVRSLSIAPSYLYSMYTGGTDCYWNILAEKKDAYRVLPTEEEKRLMETIGIRMISHPRSIDITIGGHAHHFHPESDRTRYRQSHDDEGAIFNLY
jgi:hypothetical protein